MAQIVTTSNFKQEVLDSSDIVLVDFFAPWCGPCQILLPIIDRLSKTLKSGAKIVKVNVDQSPELAGQFGIMSIPTLMVFKNGQVKDTVLGMLPENEILEMINNYR